MNRFSYSDYETICRSGGYGNIRRYLSLLAPIFKGCKKVLDIGCGQGIFLQLLASQGTPAIGVDSDEKLLALARASRVNVLQSDALDYLKTTEDEFDGMFCSHLIEHLQIDAVVALLEAACHRLTKGGLFVLVFPNPASLRMQLNFFWRDPTHVRFYQRDLIAAMLTHYGLCINPNYPEATSWRWASLAEAVPSQGFWIELKRRVRASVQRQLEIDSALLTAPEDALIVAQK